MFKLNSYNENMIILNIQFSIDFLMAFLILI